MGHKKSKTRQLERLKLQVYKTNPNSKAMANLAKRVETVSKTKLH